MRWSPSAKKKTKDREERTASADIDVPLIKAEGGAYRVR
jgi:hypothetical protein